MKEGLIFLNGDAPSEKTLKSISFVGKTVICADGALRYLQKYIEPDVIMGDFDSLGYIPTGKNVKKFPIDKDYTDGHLVIKEAAELGIDSVERYGGFGGRIDHEYANIALLALADWYEIKAVLKGEKADVYYTKGDISIVCGKNKIVSIVPYSDTAHIIQTRGLKFDAGGLMLNKLHLIGMSNQSVCDEISISVGKGEDSVLIFVER